jgi:glycosyltransferase involved in cell wall biosynthesis
MKILYDYQIFSLQKFGGASRYFYELMNHSQNLFDYEVTGLFSENIYSKALKVHKDFPLKFSFRGKSRMIDILNKLDSINRIKKECYDVIHSTLYEPYILQFRTKPLVVTVHDMIHELFPVYFPSDNIYSKNKKVMIQNADRINVNSETTKKDLLKFYPEVEEKITVIYHACSMNIQDGDKQKENYILFTGQRGGYKNFDNFIRAIAPLLVKYNLRLICTGHPFDKNETILLENLNIDDRTTCTFVSEKNIADLYAKAIAFVFPSLYEGFGIPVLEAFSVGCPAILSNTSSLPEIGGDAAIYFDPYSIEDIHSAIEKVILSHGLQKELCDKGKEQAKKFSWEKCTKETMQVYQHLQKNHD